MVSCYQEKLLIGQIGAPNGVKGWVAVYSYAYPKENIFDYKPWWVQSVSGQWCKLKVTDIRARGKKMLASLEGYVDRNRAGWLRNLKIYIESAQLPVLDPGEYYWHQLIGLAVYDRANGLLGCIDNMLETGSHDVMIVKPLVDSIDQKRRLIPYSFERVIQSIDLKQRQVIVDWDPGF